MAGYYQPGLGNSAPAPQAQSGSIWDSPYPSTPPQGNPPPPPTPQSLPVPTRTPPSMSGTLNPFKVMGAVNGSLQNWKAGAEQAGKVMDIGVGPNSPFMYPYPPLFPYPKVYSDGPSPLQGQPFAASNSGFFPSMWGPQYPDPAGNTEEAVGHYYQGPWFSRLPGVNAQGVIPPPPGGWTYPTLKDFPFPRRQTGTY